MSLQDQAGREVEAILPRSTVVLVLRVLCAPVRPGDLTIIDEEGGGRGLEDPFGREGRVERVIARGVDEVGDLSDPFLWQLPVVELGLGDEDLVAATGH